METQEFKNKVEAISKLLKMAVEFPSDEDMRWNKYGYLTEGHKKLRISSTVYNEKNHHLTIWADFPRTDKGEYAFYGHKHPEINVSDQKTPEQIARDIERRLMPEYTKELQEVVDRIEKTNLYNQRQKENIQKLADYFGVEFKEKDRDRPTIWVYDKIKGLSSTIEACREETVKFSLEVTPVLAMKIFDLMKNRG
jgi:hypothetical protein